MAQSWLDRLLGRGESVPPSLPPRAGVVEVTHVEPHGADLLFIRGTVDGQARQAFVPTNLVMSARESQRRRVLANYLRFHTSSEQAMREAVLRLQLLGREEVGR